LWGVVRAQKGESDVARSRVLPGDAPWHFAPIQDKLLKQKRAMTIEDFPLEKTR